MREDTLRVRIGHSPDADDAFMFYALASGKLDTGRYRIEEILNDIETLNHRALEGDLEVTALSAHAYAFLAGRYVLTPCGASFGDGYGPVVVARQVLDREGLRQCTIAIPGRLTSAALALRLYLGEHRTQVLPFDRILPAVQSGEVEAGLLIHEGQLTYASGGLSLIVDLGAWWKRQTGLPLPLGVNAVRRDLDQQAQRDLTRLLRTSIEYGLANRRAALDHAMTYARGLERERADRFVSMYVNSFTVELGSIGRNAVRTFLREGHRAGAFPNQVEPEFIDA
ncbi:MAG: MqnA/MqnD/SBP family protein [Acidobacteriota bacterium]